jgi:hypothetical protein
MQGKHPRSVVVNARICLKGGYKISFIILLSFRVWQKRRAKNSTLEVRLHLRPLRSGEIDFDLLLPALHPRLVSSFSLR